MVLPLTACLSFLTASVYVMGQGRFTCGKPATRGYCGSLKKHPLMARTWCSCCLLAASVVTNMSFSTYPQERQRRGLCMHVWRASALAADGQATGRARAAPLRFCHPEDGQVDVATPFRGGERPWVPNSRSRGPILVYRQPTRLCVCGGVRAVLHDIPGIRSTSSLRLPSTSCSLTRGPPIRRRLHKTDSFAADSAGLLCEISSCCAGIADRLCWRGAITC